MNQFHHFFIQVVYIICISYRSDLIFNLFYFKAQIQFVREDVTGEVQLNKTDKSFDCFSQCIEDITCKRLSRIHPHFSSYTDCFKKTSTTVSNTPSVDGQFAIIRSKSYKYF